MAVYKVIQDVEADDKLIGFLTLKGFIYAVISGLSAFIEIRLLISGLGPIRWVLMLAFLGPMILFGVLASPLGRDQPTEVWLLSRIRFFLKPHIRIWNQSGVKNLVTITVPKRIEHQLTKNLSQAEVHSRLQALASTLDSRGWATKNVNVNAAPAPNYLENSETDSDRLVEASSLPQTEQVIDVHAADDILDEQNNATAQKFANLMQKADDDRKKNIADKVNAAISDQFSAPQPSVDSTFLDQSAASDSGTTVFVGKNIVSPGAASTDDTDSKGPMTDAEAKLLERKHKEIAEIESKLPKEPVKAKSFILTEPEDKKTKAKKRQPEQVTPEVQAAKLELAQSGNDLSVASIAHLANRNNQAQQIGPEEFVIDLH